MTYPGSREDSLLDRMIEELLMSFELTSPLYGTNRRIVIAIRQVRR